MNWEELKERLAESDKNCIVCDDYVSPMFHDFLYYKDGRIVFQGEVIANKRTPDQMWQMMEALKNDKEMA